jgi:hypothetical protein
MNGSSVSRIVLGWVALYTRGLPAEARLARRDEIESDLWSQREEARSICRSSVSLAVEILARLVMGMAADVAWRLELGQRAKPPIERHSDRGTRFVAVLAIIGGIAWAIAVADWAITAATVPGVKIWEVPLLAVAGQVGLVALSFSLGGLGYILLSRYDASVGLIAMLGASCGFMTVLGSPQMAVFLPVGSVVTMLSLPRIHALGWPLALVHAGAAPGIFVGMAAYNDDSLVGIASVLVLSYCATWVAIGLEVLGGLPRARPATHPSRDAGAAAHHSSVPRGSRLLGTARGAVPPIDRIGWERTSTGSRASVAVGHAGW